ncbi:hypothetical protein PVAP13_9NG817754 [Panicum virgatum]|uniref:Uncharacterized protein n=1 Tax=Panicum virgatum TaxID=38727 RepID=A0A8T0N1V0_PANVG|nr:hypothetical protein PVAP13_9NG817754 [Panicum virgatum]KAG2542844.1 hypothetical protein PVAP13_9NG817754 [Panicum virgatum]
MQPAKASGFCRPAFFLYPSLCIGGSGRRADHRHRVAAPPPPSLPAPAVRAASSLPPALRAAPSLTPTMQSSTKSVAPPSLPTSLHCAPAMSLPPSPAVRAATLASVPAPSRAHQAEARPPLIHGAAMPSGPAPPLPVQEWVHLTWTS